MCVDVLSPQGKILFSTNYEKWTVKKFLEIINSWASKNKLMTIDAPTPELDFELSSVHRLLKSVVLTRKANL